MNPTPLILDLVVAVTFCLVLAGFVAGRRPGHRQPAAKSSAAAYWNGCWRLTQVGAVFGAAAILVILIPLTVVLWLDGDCGPAPAASFGLGIGVLCLGALRPTESRAPARRGLAA